MIIQHSCAGSEIVTAIICPSFEFVRWGLEAQFSCTSKNFPVLKTFEVASTFLDMGNLKHALTFATMLSFMFSQNPSSKFPRDVCECSSQLRRKSVRKKSVNANCRNGTHHAFCRSMRAGPFLKKWTDVLFLVSKTFVSFFCCCSIFDESARKRKNFACFLV